MARLATALGAEVLGYDVVRRPTALERFRWATLAEIVEQANIISLHCPTLDAAMLSRARPGLVLVNTARASLIDETAVLAGPEAGHLATYAADVFDSEPPRNLEFVRRPRVIATSHIGGFTAESAERATRTAVNNLLSALVPERPDRNTLVA